MRLSGNVHSIGDSWAIEGVRYAGAGPKNQSVLSTKYGAPWAIASQANLSTSRTTA